MYKRCKTEQSANRQRELEQGLLGAMLAGRYDEISISDLCDRLQVPRKSFYRYFSDKDGALEALIDHTLMLYELKNLYAMGEAADPVLAELEHFFRFWLEQKPLLDALQRSGLSNVLLDRAIGYALSQDQSRALGANAAQGEREYGILFAISGMMSMVLRWHRSGYRESAAQMAWYARQVLTRPLAGRGS